MTMHDHSSTEEEEGRGGRGGGRWLGGGVVLLARAGARAVAAPSSLFFLSRSKFYIGTCQNLKKICDRRARGSLRAALLLVLAPYSYHRRQYSQY